MTTTSPMAAPSQRASADHHLWNNHGTWWCHFTVHHADHTKQRVRLGLETPDASEARVLRDALLRLFGPQLAGAVA